MPAVPLVEQVIDWIRTTLQRAGAEIDIGVAALEDIDIDTLADRLRTEVVAAGGVAIPPPFVGAWARV